MILVLGQENQLLSFDKTRFAIFLTYIRPVEGFFTLGFPEGVW